MRPLRILLLGVILALAALTPTLGQPLQTVEAQSPTITVRLTVYLLRGVMYSGYQTHWSATACSWNLPLGTVVEMVDGQRFTCLDRGHLGSSGWLDLWMPDWATASYYQRLYGDWTTARIIRWGWGE